MIYRVGVVVMDRLCYWLVADVTGIFIDFTTFFTLIYLK